MTAESAQTDDAMDAFPLETATADYPLVSAIMLVGRAPIPDVVAAIECFQKQTYPYRELIIVNNAKTQFIASELNIKAQHDVFLIDTPILLSAGMARNYGIRAANGQILAQFDADYYHDPQRLSAQIATMAEQEAHICMLASTLAYSFISGRAALDTNKKSIIPNTMVFMRPAKIDYPNVQKYEEFGILDRMIRAGLKPITMDKPDLVCKLRLTNGERITKPTNSGLDEKLFSFIKDMLER